ncbi:glycerophosphodiester phosphodiesterase family protein [Kordia sp.]|uniref:glycerophosphodiester phosphodiesterase family protein n=1 Tax=Kordia sp. TaxID=1965332 RepID=UPI0025BB3553|nr:glycerophosphodiester phosphodiesterase family protein [Kordia sp.]MCH2195741.1 glycerophosphodiester phosphodiesterase [Kordia sp.]
MKFFLRILVLSCTICLWSCTEDPSKLSHRKMVDIQGHRGCRGLLPENSIIGFEKAIDLEVHTLELDVVISKDHKVVVSHEPFMNHEIVFDLQGNPIPETEEKQYNLYQMSYDSIRQYDCGTKKHPRFLTQKKAKVAKPLLEDVIKIAEAKTKNDIKYNIEIKRKPSYDEVYAPKLSEFVRLVIEVVQKHKLANRVNLQAFDLETLEEIKKQAPKMDVALLVDENEDMKTKLEQLSFKPEIMSPYYKLLTKENIKEYQRRYGMKVIPWTVNNSKEMEQLINWDVDGIITDYPNILRNLYKN